MDAERRPREGRPGVRQLRDISHLYISTRPAARPAAVPVPRRLLRIAVAGAGPAALRSCVAANLAVQFARLGRRTLVVDLDPALPGTGYRLGLSPADALAHVPPGDGPRLVWGLQGIRVLCGVAGDADFAAHAAPLQPELHDVECVIVPLPAAPAASVLRDLRALLPEPAADSTLSRAAAHSPMIGAWLATSQRPVASPMPAASAADVALWVVDAKSRHADPPEELQQAAEVQPRRVYCGDEAPAGDDPASWARVPGLQARTWLPVSEVHPQHPAARAYEGLSQAILAAGARPVG